MESVGRLARRFGLSRTALLYYDRIGLLRPAARSTGNYREYGEEEVRRLEEICRYRRAGLPLSQVREVLERGAADRTAEVLSLRLEALNQEISRLREQQRIVVRLLQGRARMRRVRAMDKARWVELLRRSGLSDEDMERWHVEFERLQPAAHQDFLESLGISPEEIRRIRAWSRKGAHI